MSRQWIGRFILSLTAGGLFCGLTACSKASAPQGALDATESYGIFGGEPVQEDDAIATSTIAILNRRAKQIVCTGSLIGPNLVVTAAHCTSETPADLAIVFTRKLPKNRRESASIQIRSVVAGQTHPQWPLNTFETDKEWGDIALLRFDGDIPPNYQPAHLLSDGQELKSGVISTLAGFGWTNSRKKTPAEGLNKTQVKIVDPDFSTTEILLNQKEGHGACHGDSGGPAFITVNNQLLLIGVTSRGHDDPDDTCDHFSIYTNIVAHADWMKEASLALQEPGAIGRKIPQPF